MDMQAHHHDHHHGHDHGHGPQAAADESLPAGTVYTYPMHPEVRQDHPGNCPKCGMTLEPVLPTLDEDENPELADFRRRFWWTLPLTLVVTLLAMVGGIVLGSALTMKVQYYRMVYEGEATTMSALLTALVDLHLLPERLRRLAAV